MEPAASRSRPGATSGAVLGRVLAAVVLLAAGSSSLLATAAPAGAATCASSGGVSVVVDFRELGGGTVTACSPDGGGRSAAAIFASVGVELTYATRQPGFVCRVDGAPASDPCVSSSPADAYWGLWWADGSRAAWTYSSSSVGALTVPAGGSVGWSWQQDRATGATVPPGVAPPVTATSSPSTSPSPTSSPTKTPTKTPSTAPTTAPTKAPTKAPTTSPSPAPTSDPTSSRSPRASEPPGGSRGRKEPGDRDEDRPREVGPRGDSGAGEAADPAGSAPSPPDRPGRVPAPITWAVVGLLAIGIVVSAAVARRRRGADAP